MGSYHIACGLSGVGLGNEHVILVPLVQRSLKDGAMPVVERIGAYRGSPCNGLYQFYGQPKRVFLDEYGRVGGERLDHSAIVLHPEIYEWCLNEFQLDGRMITNLKHIKAELRTDQRLGLERSLWSTEYIIFPEDKRDEYLANIETTAIWISHLAAIAWGYYCARRILLPWRTCSDQNGEEEFRSYLAKVSQLQARIAEADRLLAAEYDLEDDE
jgi:hypothetical protein